jgi:hypothetical protein
VTRIAFLTWVVDSYGEREQALRFAAQIAGELEPVFVVPAVVAPYLARYATATFHDVDTAMRALDDLGPALVIANEYYNLPVALQRMLGASAHRLATFDGTSMGLAINTNPFAAPVPLRTMALPPTMFRLRACPINDPAPDTPDAYHWRLFDAPVRTRGAIARAALGIDATSRLALLAIAPWAVSAAMSLGQLDHYEVLTRQLAAALSRVGARTTLVVVAPVARPPVSRGAAEVRFVEYLPREIYEDLLLGADLVISDNAIQTSIAKAMMASIPTLVAINSRPDFGPTYQMFPLKVALPPESAYLRVIRPTELGDVDALADRIAQAWRGDHEPARAAYLASLAHLASPLEILDAAGVRR